MSLLYAVKQQKLLWYFRFYSTRFHVCVCVGRQGFSRVFWMDIELPLGNLAPTQTATQLTIRASGGHSAQIAQTAARLQHFSACCYSGLDISETGLQQADDAAGSLALTLGQQTPLAVTGAAGIPMFNKIRPDVQVWVSLHCMSNQWPELSTDCRRLCRSLERSLLLFF